MGDGSIESGTSSDGSMPADATGSDSASFADGPETQGDTSTPMDGWTMTDASEDVVVRDASGDAPSEIDTGLMDSGATDTGMVDSGPRDTGVDAPQDSSPPVEAGCGPVNTVQNCGACGQSCASASTSTASPGCSGTACTYQCNSGYLDCNASVSYDPDGCECNVTNTNSSATCCSGNACPTQHTDGLNSTYQSPSDINYYDCNPVGTYTQSTAMEACVNWVGAANSSKCSAGSCSSGPLVVCAGMNSTCVCWEYAAGSGSSANVGKVGAASQGNNNCFCPGNSSATTTDWQ